MTETLAITRNAQDLERLEGIIQNNIGAFYEVGRALMEIKRKNYYSEVLGFETFEEYCKTKWDFTKSYANYLIASTSVIDNVSSMTTIVVKPITETQARPLSKLEPEQQRIAWAKAVETAPEGKITAAHVSRVVKGMTKKPAEPEKPKEPEEPKKPKKPRKGKEVHIGGRINALGKEVDIAFEKAWDMMTEAIKGLNTNGWKTMTMDETLNWISKLTYIVENMKRSEQENDKINVA